MSRSYRTVTYRDELLADGTVRRAYSDERQEWRRRGPGPLVSWRDERGRTGVDEKLGPKIVKRIVDGAGSLYGRELGYGRTAWSDGILTVNQTSVGGRAGAILAGIGAAALLPVIIDPPLMLSPVEEAELRRQGQGADSGGGGGGEVSGSDEPRDDDWAGSADGTSDDFG